LATKSIYWPDAGIGEGRVKVTGDEHRHLTVSRTAQGEPVELFDGAGRVWTGTVRETNRRDTVVDVEGGRYDDPPSRQIVLAQALVKSAAFETILEKAVEIGVTRIVPFRAAYSNETGQGRDRRWRRIIVEAAKQSKHYHLPVLDPVTDLESVVGIDAASRVLFSERGDRDLEDAVRGDPVLYLIGPEGGWRDDEIELAWGGGVQSVRLGRHIFRAETAAVVGGALIADRLGIL